MPFLTPRGAIHAVRSSGMADWQEVWASGLALHEERVRIKLGFRTTPPPDPGWLSELKQERQVT